MGRKVFTRFHIDFGIRVRDLRIEKDLSQEALAERTNSTKQTISRIECGKQEALASLISDLSDALDVSCDYLLKGIVTEKEAKLLDDKMLTLSSPEYRFISDIMDSFFELKKQNDNNEKG